MSKISRQRKWQIKKKAQGLCIICGDKAVTTTLCQEHREKQKLHSSRYAKKNPIKMRNYASAWKKKHPDYMKNYYRNVTKVKL